MLRFIKNYVRSHWVLLLAAFVAGTGLALTTTFMKCIDENYFRNIPFGQQSYDYISSDLPISERKTIINSRNSTVKIYSTMFLDYPPFTVPISGTGVYVIYNEKPYVLTAAHMVSENCAMLFVSTPFEESTSCLDVAFMDENLDIALLEVNGFLLSADPVLLNDSLNRSKDYPIGEQIYYTGYPNDSGRLTIKGQIAGHSYDQFLLQSYAWHGASGAGIFNINGDLIGVVSAVQVGYNGEGLELIETIVYGAPIAAINFSMIQ